jgi:hypothetical protein
MPTCENCGDYFPNYVRIDGKLRNLHSRKYCLKCSPFGARLTRRPGTTLSTKYTKELLQKAVSKNFTISGVMRDLRGDVPPSGSLHTHLKNQIKKFGIDTSHFTGKGYNKGGTTSQKISWKKILVYHRLDGREKIRILRRALLESGRKYICEGCNISEWLGKHLVLEIHHKNGDNRDNRPKNLVFLCPNCHSNITK